MQKQSFYFSVCHAVVFMLNLSKSSLGDDHPHHLLCSERRLYPAGCSSILCAAVVVVLQAPDVPFVPDVGFWRNGQ